MSFCFYYFIKKTAITTPPPKKNKLKTVVKIKKGYIINENIWLTSLIKIKKNEWRKKKEKEENGLFLFVRSRTSKG